MSDTLIKLETAGGLARLTLNNPDAGNVLDAPMIEALDAVTAQLAAEPPRAVLITAEGKNFCVGGDIRAFHTAPDRGELLHRMAGRLHDSVRRLAALKAPVVAAVQGAAAGAGLSLAAGADMLIAARGATFTMAYTGIGISSDGGASYYLPRLIGLRRTQELAYTNRRIPAEEAFAWGLVSAVAEDDALAAEAEALAQRLAAGPTLAYAAMKRLLAAEAGLDAQLDAELDNVSTTAASRDASEGVAAFLARRQPDFTGS
jgi:2-(1,2-epoxy-1,2-dihydrophenyl)acetyl-CoA isomerase